MIEKEQIYFSVIIPIYNREKFIEKTINSVLNQTYSKFQLICVNDGSSDKTQQILNEFETKDSRIEIITLTKNCGRCIARNEGIKKAKGNWLCFLDSDDYYLDFHLEVLSKMIIKYKEYNAFCTSQINNKQKRINETKKINKKFIQLNIKSFLRGNPIQINQLCIKKDINILFPNERIPYGEDWLFFRLICLNHTILKTNQITNVLVEHENRSMNKMNWVKYVESNVKAGIYFANVVDDKWLKNKILSFSYVLGMNILLSKGFKKESYMYLKLSSSYVNNYFDILFYKGIMKYFIKI